MRKAARVDANQAEIVKALRAIGASVAITSQLGAGFPDLVVGYRGRNFLIEIKDGSRMPSQRKLTADEIEFAMDWRGTYAVVESVGQALQVVTA